MGEAEATLDPAPFPAVIDSFGRTYQYLRLSLTEACNMACSYCLPRGFPEWYRHKARLGIKEIQTILEGFRLLGFKKVRFTGGEPTVHPQCLRAVKLARDLGYEQIAVTTNGLLINDLEPWLASGLTHLNVSCDSVDPAVFETLTGSSDLGKVLSLVEHAVTTPLVVKVNAVLMRSKNGSDKDIAKMIQWALARPLTLRFIELMDTGLNQSFAAKERVLGTDILKVLAQLGLTGESPLASKAPLLAGPSRDLKFAGFPGRVGLINPLSCNFCSLCNRLRVTAKGRLKLCLFGDHDFDIDLTAPRRLAADVLQHIGLKGERHQLEAGLTGNVKTFRTIGG